MDAFIPSRDGGAKGRSSEVESLEAGWGVAVRERGPEDIQKVVWGEVRCRWGRVDVAEVLGLVVT